MIRNQSMYWTLNEFPDLQILFFCCFLHFFLKVPCDGTGEMYFINRVVVLHYIPLKEIAETTY